jgi:hypothetical protein
MIPTRDSHPEIEPDPPPPADLGDAFGTPAHAPAAVEGIPPAADPDDALLPVTELAESDPEAESTALVDTVTEPPDIPETDVPEPLVTEATGPVSEADPVLATVDPPFEGYGEHPSDASLSFEH